MAAAQTILIDVIARANTGQLNKAKRDILSLGAASNVAANQAMGGMAALGRASQAAGTALLVGVAVSLAIGAKAAIDFESSFAGVRKTVEASEGGFTRLARGLRDLALEIPVSITEINKIAELGGQLGVPAEGLVEFTEVVAKLGATTNLGTEEAATGIARFANVMGTAIGDFDRLASSIVFLGNNYATTESEILTFATRLSGIGATVGASEAGILGISAAFSSLGVPAERGATAIQRALIKMFTAVRSGGDELNLFAATAGVTAEVFAETFAEDPLQALVMFERGLDKLNDTGGDTTGVLAALGLGAQRSVDTLLKGAQGWEILEAAIRDSTQASRDNVAADEEAQKRFETTSSRLKLLGNAAKDLGISIGDSTIGPIKSLIDRLSALVKIVDDNKWALLLLGGIFAAWIAGQTLLKLSNLFLGLVNNLHHFEGGILRSLYATERLSTGLKYLKGFGGLAAIGLGLVAAAMANARAKTERMTDAAEHLNEVLSDPESGVIDKRKAFVEGIEASTASGSQSIFAQFDDTGEVQRILEAAGVSFADFIDAAIEGEAKFAYVERDILDIFEQRKIAAFKANASQQSTSVTKEGAERASRELELVTELIAKTRQQVELEHMFELARRRRLDLENPFSLQQELDAIHGRGDPFQSAIAFLEGRSLVDTIGDMLGPEADTDAINQYLDTVLEGVDHFGESFADRWESILDNFAANLMGWNEIWDGYEAAVAPNVEDIIASITAWRLDSGQILDTQAFIAAEYGAAWSDFWLGLDRPMQAGLAALRAADPNEFLRLWEIMFTENTDQMIDVAVAAMTQVGVEVKDKMETELPQVISEGLAAAVEEGWEPGTQAWSDFMTIWVGDWLADIRETSPEVADSLEAMMRDGVISALPQVEEFGGMMAPGIVANINAEMTTLERIQAFHDTGLSWAVSIWMGMMSYDLPGKAGNLGGSIIANMDQDVARASRSHSPSKMSMEWGQNIGEGFKQGLVASLSDTGTVVSSMFQQAAPATSIQQTSNQTTHIYMERLDNTADQVQLGLLMGGVTERIEWAGPIGKIK